MKNLQANELRIGNLYLPNGYYSASIINANDIGTIEKGVGIEFYNPIRLGANWILKLGFELSNHPDFDYHINIKGLRDERFTSTIGLIVWADGVIEVYRVNAKTYINTAECCCVAAVKYVHQLQNLYFALTGEELEVKS